MELYHGRPQIAEGRLDKEMRVYDLLDSLHIPYERTDHQAAMTMEDCQEIDRILEIVICKNLFLCNRQHTHFYMLMMPGDKIFKTRDLSGQLGTSRLSFAKPEYMLEFLDITPGAVSVMGLMNDKENHVQLLIDRDILSGELMGCHPCVNTSSLRMKTKDILDRFLPAVGHAPIVVDLPAYE